MEMVSGATVKPTVLNRISWFGQQSDVCMNAPWFKSLNLAVALCELCIAISFTSTLRASDTTPPQLISVGSLDSSMIGVCFSETLNPATATNPNNYAINSGDVNVSAVTLRPDGKSVVLSVSGGFTTLSVTVNNVRDVAGNVIATNSTVTGSIWAYSVDVGFPLLYGSSYSCQTGDVDMLAGGTDIGGTSDQFQLVYQYWQGDFDMKVKVQRLDPTDSLAKAGLLARDSLDDTSRTIQAFTTPVIGGVGFFQASRRSIQGSGTTQWGTNATTTLPNAWLRLRRQGNIFTAFYGTNGSSWLQFGQVTQAMFDGLFIGMAATSRNDNQRTTAEFRNFSFGSPPLISVHPQSQTVSPGATVVLSVTANGLTPIQYQWRLNGVNIPEANGSTFIISNAQLQDAGRYSVVVVDALGNLEHSNPADVVVTVPSLPFSDTFGSGSAVITGSAGGGRGTNTTATKQAGEPNHAGNTGGKSVWISWRAPFDGFVRFNTRGSGFDTLLAAYTGTNVANLTPVVSDDDSDGFGTSKILFTTQSDQLYWIAVDGRAAASGNIALSWQFEFGQPVPEIAASPTNRAVPPGGSTTFRVAATNATEFQWYLNDSPISGATSSNLLVSGVTVNDVGAYTVRIGNPSSLETVFTRPAYLEIGTLPGRTSHDKFEDIFGTNSPPGFAAVTSSTPFPVAAGTLDSQILNNNNSTTQQGETDHCGTLSSATRWFGLQAGNNTSGLTFVIDTAGSAINTVLAVYAGTNIFTLTNINCARGPGGASSVQFSATAITTYSAAVDGLNGAQGTIRLNWKLGSAPVITTQPANQVAIPGTNVTFVCQASGVPTPKFQWRSNDVNIANATNSTLVLNNVRSNHVANYSVMVSNFMGVVASANARLTVAYPYTIKFDKVATNGMQALRLLLPTNELATNIYVIQGTTNFSNWTSLRTNQMPTTLTTFVDPAQTNLPYRFYRLVPLTP